MAEDFREDSGEFYPGGTVVPGVPGYAPVEVDDTLTRDGSSPVKSSGIWSAIWGAVSAPAASVYEWVVKRLSQKVDKENGKGLSANDYTNEDKNKLNGIEEGAQKNPDLSGYAKKEDVKYALIEVPLKDIINLSDKAVNRVIVDDSLSSITFIFPEKVDGVARDFFIRLEIIGDTIPTISFVEPNGDAVSFDVDDESWAEIEKGVNILMFSDTGE